ncbi:hypothetical protein CRU96_13500 [Malaciobacter halophilus]|nr:hypothetical protein [Malaciobacter halophilus]RYA22353.1 hypothetical protein CRU96_13500 [Malaciobacter halophilus]
MQDFINRSFKDLKTNKIVYFSELLTQNISVILGEPASGKTYQLRQFKKENNEVVHFVNLINIESEKNLELIQNKKYILLDSIDEALVDYKNHKKLQKQLTEFIKSYRNQNPNIKFVLTCRQLEWNDYFKSELEELDKTLTVYQIQDLTKDEINQLLIQVKIDTDEFWEFISKNYLDFLLKNILVIFNIIDNYKEYQNKELNFIDIYFDLIKEHLSVKGDDREVLSSETLIRLINISSSLATYMLLNRKSSISFKNPNKLLDELYEIDNKPIKQEELETILNTSLFKKDGGNFSFFHKSVQEFLMAHFINEKKLDLQTIKELFSHELRFYEEFEEVIIYLTNLNNDLFNKFVEFDPFIFKRHPSLTKEQQQTLLTSMLYKLKNEKSMAWGRWHDFEGTTLVRFDKLKLSTLIQNFIKSSDIDKLVFAYLIALLEYNYSKEMEDLIFKYLENYSNGNLSSNEEYDEISHSKFAGNKNLRELIEDNFIDNLDFNKRLFEFLKSKKLLNSNMHKISMLDLEVQLFESLYGIKYIIRYGDNKKADFIDTKFEFENLIELLDAIPNRELEYIVPYLKPMDTLKWLEYIEKKNDKEHNNHTNLWCVYAVLLHNNSKDSIKKVFEFLNTHFIYVDNIEIEQMPFDFKKISNNFWEIYFSINIEKIHHVDAIFKFLNISLEDIKKVTLKYLVENYVKYYEKLKFNKDIDKYLMSNNTFEAHVKATNKYWEEERKKHKQELENQLLEDEVYQQRIQNKAKYKRICEDSLKALAIKQDFYNVFICEEIFRDENSNKLFEILTPEQHKQFLDFIKNDLVKDVSYKKIKENVNATQYNVLPTALYIYFLVNNDSSKIVSLEQSNLIFEKIFFHTFRFHKIKEKYFILLANEYFDNFILLIQELVELSLEQSEHKDLIYLYEFREVIEKIKKFNKENLSRFIQSLLNLDKNIFKIIKDDYKIEEILKIISLEEKSYDFIDNLRIIDSDRAYLYLEYLLKIDPKRALSSYFLEYKTIPTKIKFYKLKKLFNLKIKDEDNKNSYDKQNINQYKIKLFKDLISALKKNKGIDFLKDEYIHVIINDYYLFFNEYQRPTGVYSPGIYDGMNEYINYIWKSIGSDSNHINLLKQLSNNRCKRLSDSAKYYLQEAFNNQNKNRSHLNNYYKKIFDKDYVMSKSNLEKIKNKWEKLTMYQKITITVAIIGTIILPIWLNLSSTNVKINNNNQSPIIQENHGNIIYNIDSSKNQSIYNNVEITKKIDNLINLTTINIQGNNQQEQKDINTKIYILNEAKRINEKNISIADKNQECKSQALNSKNFFGYEINIMNEICNEIFK